MAGMQLYKGGDQPGIVSIWPHADSQHRDALPIAQTIQADIVTQCHAKTILHLATQGIGAMQQRGRAYAATQR